MLISDSEHKGTDLNVYELAHVEIRWDKNV